MFQSVGIDFGNYTFVVGISKSEGAEIIRMREQKQTINRSVVLYSNNGRSFGQISNEEISKYPQNTITNLMNLIKFCPKTEDGIKIFYENDFITVFPEQCILYLFCEIKETFSEHQIRNFVITVNTGLRESQRRRIKSLGQIAGIPFCHILNASTAYSISFMIKNISKLPKFNEKSVTIAIIDIGDTNATFSIAEVRELNVEMKTVISSEKVSGQKITELFERYLIEKVRKEFQIDVTKSAKTRLLFHLAVEEAKKKLSLDSTCQIDLKPITNDDITFQVKRKEFNDQMAAVVSDLENLLGEGMRNSSVEIGRFFEVLLFGGSSKCVFIQQELKRILGRRPKTPPNFEEWAAIGSCYLGQLHSPIATKNFFVKDLAIHSVIARYSSSEIPLFEKNSQIPSIHTVKIPVRNEVALELFNELGERLGSVRIKTGINDEIPVSICVQMSFSQLIEIVNCFYSFGGKTAKADLELSFEGDLSGDLIQKLEETEKKMRENEVNRMKIEEAILGISSNLAKIDNEKNFFDFVEPSDVEAVKNRIDEVRSWFSKNKDLRSHANVFVEKQLQLKSLSDGVFHRMEIYEASAGELNAMKEKANSILAKFQNKADQKILSLLSKFIGKIEDAQKSMKYNDVNFNIEQNKVVLDKLNENLENKFKGT